jgi:hypothetical protein
MATWSDIDRVADRIEQLNKSQIEELLRVIPPGSENPNFVVRRDHLLDRLRRRHSHLLAEELLQKEHCARVNNRWPRIFNRVFELINTAGPGYYSGGRFIGAVREVDPYFPDYSRYIETRRAANKSTSRKDYYYDILLELPEESRLRLLDTMLGSLAGVFPDKVAEIRDELGGGAVAVPSARVSHDAWNADRLNRYLSEIDTRIAARNHTGAVTLAYTCLEGFLKAFVRHHMPEHTDTTEIIELSKLVRKFLRETLDSYPDEALSMITHIGHTIDRTRNGFSESHFDQEAARWLAVFVRDLINSEMRLLLHFMSEGTS